MGISGIYIITNKVNGKMYVGSSNDIRRRWNEHRSELLRGIHLSPRLQNAWNKYGALSFEWQVLEKVSENKLIDREQYWLDKCQSYDRHVGYNIYPRADRCIMSEETKQKISRAHIGKKMSLEFCQRQSERVAGKGNPMFGRHHTEKAKEKNRQTALKRWARIKGEI